MKSAMRRNVGVGVLIIGLFIGLAPIPFLSKIKVEERTSISDMPLMVLRLGQDIATAAFKDVSGLPREPRTKLMQVVDLKFSIEFDESLVIDNNEIEAIADAAAQPDVARQFSSAQRIRFEGWRPSFLPLRITYRYILAAAFGIILFGLFVLLYRDKA
jgi:hypothetical protein